MVAPGTDGHVLTTVSGVAAWAALSGGSGGGSATGARMHRASATAMAATSGARYLASTFDTIDREDSGFTVDLAAGTITVDVAGWYLLSANVTLSGGVSGGVLAVNDRATDAKKVRGANIAATITTYVANGAVYLDAGTAVAPYFFTSSSSQIIGHATDDTYTFFSTVLL